MRFSTAICTLAWVVASAASAHAEGYRFLLPDVIASPGERLVLPVDGEYEQSSQGFSMAARFSSATLTLERIHAEETILEAIGTDFIDVTVDPDDGIFTVGVLVDSRPPFDGTLIPNILRPLTLLYIEAQVSPEAETDAFIRLENGLSTPPIDNVYVVDNYSIPVTELTEARIRVATEPVPAFLRGDTNMDERHDLTDGVYLLRVQFVGEGHLGCLEAADINDDTRINLSDAIHLLAYLYRGGPAPPPPMASPGLDPSPDGGFGCEEPLYFLGR